MLFGNIADGPQGVNDPKTMADVGNGFPMRQGYTIVWSGWDPDAPRANMGLGLTAPVATDNGKPIVKMVREEFCLRHARAATSRSSSSPTRRTRWSSRGHG